MTKTRHITFVYQQAIRASGLPPGPRLVALVLAGHVNPIGWCYLSNQTLARECGASSATVRRWKRELQAAGWVRITKTGGGVGQAPEYVVAFPNAISYEQGDVETCSPSDRNLLAHEHTTARSMTQEQQQNVVPIHSPIASRGMRDPIARGGLPPRWTQQGE